MWEPELEGRVRFWRWSLPHSTGKPEFQWAIETQLAQMYCGLSITIGLALQHKSQIILWPHIYTWAGLLLDRPQLILDQSSYLAAAELEMFGFPQKELCPAVPSVCRL